jgi:tetratricopeptide (TPR) repeat protein
MLKSPQERYVLAALPFLHLGAAFTIVRGVEWAQGRAPSLGHIAPGGLTPARIGAGVLAALAIAWPLPELLATRHSLSLPDSRHLSRRWVNQNLDPNRPMAVELYGPVFYDNERPIVTWPFFATQSQVVRPAYHPEFLDGLDYYVASGEISRRFGSEAEHYPVENAYYRWFQEHTSVVWESDPKTTSGPQIAIRRLPRSISTRAQRDSIFAVAMPKPTQAERLDLWCIDCSRIFARAGDYGRAEEWARRGLKVGVKASEAQLRCALSIALWYEGQLDSAEAEVRLAVREDPRNAAFHMYHGAILTDMKRFEDALVELRESIRLDPNQQGADLLRKEIAQLEAELGEP